MTGVSTLGQALEQIERIKQQQTLFGTLSTQLATGKKTQLFSGLGNDALTSQRARLDIDSLNAYSDNITNAQRRIDLTASAIAQFKSQAQDFLNALVQFQQQGVHQAGDKVTYDDPLTPAVEDTAVGMTSSQPDVSLSTLQKLASNIYGFVTDLLNTQDNGRYVLAGAETRTQPFTDSGTLDSALSSLISQWKSGTISSTELKGDLSTNVATPANPGAITDTIVGYSSSLSAGNAGNVFVRVQQNSEIDYTALANDPSFRDVIVALSYFKNGDLGPIADTYTPPNAYPGVPDAQGAPGATLDDQKANFYDVFNKLTSMVTNAITRVDQISTNLENARTRITEIGTAQTDAKNVLLTTVSDVENVDPNEIAVKINALQVQLNASLAVTASSQNLSLVNFLNGN